MAHIDTRKTIPSINEYKSRLANTAMTGPQRWAYGEWHLDATHSSLLSPDIAVDLDQIAMIYPHYTPATGYDPATWLMQAQKMVEYGTGIADYQWLFQNHADSDDKPPKVCYDFTEHTISSVGSDSKSVIVVDKLCDVLSGLDYSVAYFVEKRTQKGNGWQDDFLLVTEVPEAECSAIRAVVYRHSRGDGQRYFRVAECQVDSDSEAREFFDTVCL